MKMLKKRISLVVICDVLIGLNLVYGQIPQSQYRSESVHTTESSNTTSFGKGHANIQFMPSDKGIENAIDYISGDFYYLDPNESNVEPTPWDTINRFLHFAVTPVTAFDGVRCRRLLEC